MLSHADVLLDDGVDFVLVCRVVGVCVPVTGPAVVTVVSWRALDDQMPLELPSLVGTW